MAERWLPATDSRFRRLNFHLFNANKHLLHVFAIVLANPIDTICRFIHTMTQFKTSPPKTSFSKLGFPADHILLITLSRPKSLNCINYQGHVELDAVYKWFDHEPQLRVAIITGEGRAFCAGADLKGKKQVTAPNRCFMPLSYDLSYKNEK